MPVFRSAVRLPTKRCLPSFSLNLRPSRRRPRVSCFPTVSSVAAVATGTGFSAGIGSVAGVELGATTWRPWAEATLGFWSLSLRPSRRRRRVSCFAMVSSDRCRCQPGPPVSSDAACCSRCCCCCVEVGLGLCDRCNLGALRLRWSLPSRPSEGDRHPGAGVFHVLRWYPRLQPVPYPHGRERLCQPRARGSAPVHSQLAPFPPGGRFPVRALVPARPFRRCCDKHRCPISRHGRIQAGRAPAPLPADCQKRGSHK